MKSKLLLFPILVFSLEASSLWIPEELPLGKESASCYVPLQLGTKLDLLSKDRQPIALTVLQEYANDSANARYRSLNCLRSLAKTEENRNNLLHGYEISLMREDHLFRMEIKILLSQNREYPLTPMEEKSVKEWLENRNELVEGIRSLTKEALQFSDPDWEKKKEEWKQNISSHYGSLLREREKFLLSLSVESRSSYIQYLTKFTENK